MTSRREMSIAEVGAMGVPLIFNPDDRSRAMLLMVVVALIKMIFMAYMLWHILECASPNTKSLPEWEKKPILAEDAFPWAKVPLLAAAVTAHGLQCLVDVCKCWRVQNIAKTGWDHVTKDGNDKVVLKPQKPLEGCFAWTLIYVDGLLQPFINFFIGGLWLCTSTDVESLVLDATAVYFVSQLDEYVVQAIVCTDYFENVSISHEQKSYWDKLWQYGTFGVILGMGVVLGIGIYIMRN